MIRGTPTRSRQRPVGSLALQRIAGEAEGGAKGSARAAWAGIQAGPLRTSMRLAAAGEGVRPRRQGHAMVLPGARTIPGPWNAFGPRRGPRPDPQSLSVGPSAYPMSHSLLQGFRNCQFQPIMPYATAGHRGGRYRRKDRLTAGRIWLDFFGPRAQGVAGEASPCLTSVALAGQNRVGAMIPVAIGRRSAWHPQDGYE